MVTYRSLLPGEWPAAMELWLDAFGNVGWIFDSLNEGTADRKLEHTLIAEADGKVVGAVDVFMREMRDESGNPVKVGAIGSVATHKEYRNQGISGQLLLNAIELMERDGCGWSMLFASYFSHYGRYGWEQIGWKARVCHEGEGVRDSHRYEVKSLGNVGPWPMQELAQIYDSFNGNRPLSHVRTALYWDIPIRVRLERPEKRTWTASMDGKCVAYLVVSADLSDPSVGGLGRRPEVEEIGYLPGSEDALQELMSEALGTHVGEVFVRVPFDSAVDSCLQTCFADVRGDEAFGPMARAIAPDWSLDRIRSLMAQPGAHFYGLDNF